MSGPLANMRHELFAQELAKGKPQLEAYRLAGYQPIESSASRLLSHAKVSARVEELKAGAAEKAEFTIADMANQLDEDRDFARQLDAPAAAISASVGKAKVLGLIRDKVEHSGPGGIPLAITVNFPDAARQR